MSYHIRYIRLCYKEDPLYVSHSEHSRGRSTHVGGWNLALPFLLCGQSNACTALQLFSMDLHDHLIDTGTHVWLTDGCCPHLVHTAAFEFARTLILVLWFWLLSYYYHEMVSGNWNGGYIYMTDWYKIGIRLSSGRCLCFVLYQSYIIYIYIYIYIYILDMEVLWAINIYYSDTRIKFCGP